MDDRVNSFALLVLVHRVAPLNMLFAKFESRRSHLRCQMWNLRMKH